MKFRLFIFLSLILLSTVTFGQSKKKKKQNNSFVGKAYHDITGRNNGYFNANEKMKGIQRAMREGHRDDFTQIIPIYTDRDPEAGKSFTSDLDAIVTKTSTVIQRHEPSRWADDSYFALGKAYFFKNDFDNSVKAFQFIIREYKEVAKKKKKGKSKGKPMPASKSSSSSSASTSKGSSKKPMTAAQMKAAQEAAAQAKLEEKIEAKEAAKEAEVSGGMNEEKYYKEKFPKSLKHKSIHPDAYIWLADNYTAMDKYKEAEAVFTIIDAGKKFPFRLSDELDKARANLYLSKGDYEKAMEPLVTLLAKVKKSKKNNRFHFIIAQIHERNKSYSDAVKHYKKSLKGRPPYDMQFAAMMSIARIASNDNSMSTSEIRKMLTKLSKDKKNEEYLDQVYYYLAELCLRESDKPCAIENLDKSVEKSMSNTRQKAISHLKLADLYFNDEIYREAQINYAAAVTLIDDKYPNFREYKLRSEILEELVKHLDIIAEQDSLQAIAALSDKELDKFLRDYIFKKEQQAKAEKEAKDAPQLIPSAQAERGSPTDEPSKATDWYFYNSAARSNGFNDFMKRWGARKNEDNWRRSDKKSDAFEDISDKELMDDEDQATASSGLDLHTLKKNFPIEPDAKAKSDEMILMALYEAATIYKSKLNNSQKALEMFEDLLQRYPKNKYEAQVYYNLYLLHNEQGNTAKAEYYKNLLLKGYPDSPYTKYILNPNYIVESESKTKQVDDYYKLTFGYYQQGAYDTVLLMANAADSMYKDNYLKPKFALLHAFAVGKTQDLKSYKEELTAIITSYPNDPVKDKAKEIIEFLDKTEVKEIKLEVDLLEFDYEPLATHFFMVQFLDKTVKANDVNLAIAKYNEVNRSLEDLKANSLILKDDLTVIIVKSFKNLITAKNYLAAITKSETFKTFPEGSLQFSIVSDSNFNMIVKNRNTEAYRVFYETRYSE